MSSSNTENNNNNNKNTTKKEQESGSIANIDKIKFNKDEMNLLNSSAKELGMDNEHFSDLKDLPAVPDMSEDEMNRILNDTSQRTLIKDIGDDPQITETIREGEEIGRLKAKDFKEIQEQVSEERQNLVMWLGSQPRIRLHIKAGVRNNKTIWVEKEFPYRSLDKRAELNLGLMRARLQAIQIKHNLLGNKPLRELSNEDKSFLDLSQFMIEIAGYRLAEYEAQLRFGMSTEDFARVDSNEFTLATQAYVWRIANIPYYKPRQ